MTDHRFAVGDIVRIPADFCPGCGDYLTGTTGLITGTEADDRVHRKLAEEHPGPYYTVLVDHAHNADGHLVYAERELTHTTEKEASK